MLRTTILVTLALSAAAHAETRTYKIENNRLVLPSPIVFDTAKDTLKPESDAALGLIVQYLDDKPAVTLLRIEVHSDNAGSEDFNLKLTQKRALSVGMALVAKGVSCKRLIAVGFGSQKPVADNRTPEGKAQNRRTELVNAELRGKAIGGMPVDGGGRLAGELCAKK